MTTTSTLHTDTARPPLADARTEGVAMPTPAAPDAALMALCGHTEMDRLCGMVLAFPRTAERLLTERRLPDAVVRYTLLAETAVRLGKAREAVVIASAALTVAGQQRPIVPGRLLPAATVLADATVLAGRTDAIQSCTDLDLLARRHGDEQRATIAAGLHAAAVLHQHGCRAAEELLTALGHACTDSTVLAAIDLAVRTIQTGCARRDEPHWPPTTIPVATCGGLVQVALTTPLWADRIARWPAIHHCTRTAERPA